MAILTSPERSFAESLSHISHCNPFLPERIAHERQALGDEFDDSEAVWHVRPDSPGDRPNITHLLARAVRLAEMMRKQLLAGQRASDTELERYQDLVLYVLYYDFPEEFLQVIRQHESRKDNRRPGLYRKFLDRFDYFFKLPGLRITPRYEPRHFLAICFQIRRAFHHIFRYIIGGSMPAARLRAAAWQSIFTSDMRRYVRALHGRMADFTTLIVGPSGTGKELVARAIGLSRYIPFNIKTLEFTDDFRASVHALNLSALSPTLIESELFGHRRGAFTGALEDRAGWLEICKPLGTVFLDEIGDIDPAIQVKLLRVLQTRQFQRIGDTAARTFTGKIIAATNRDLAQQMRDGRVREDFYYRICSDVIVTPSLAEILRDSPRELGTLTLFVAQRLLDESLTDGHAASPESQRLADEVTQWITKHLGPAYPWPGNFRELEQCVRNILIRGEYRPARVTPSDPAANLTAALNEGGLTADALLRRYCTLVYARTGNYDETARRLKLDRRTIKAKIDVEHG